MAKPRLVHVYLQSANLCSSRIPCTAGHRSPQGRSRRAAVVRTPPVELGARDARARHAVGGGARVGDRRVGAQQGGAGAAREGAVGVWGGQADGCKQHLTPTAGPHVASDKYRREEHKWYCGSCDGKIQRTP